MGEAGPALLAIGRGRGDNRAADAARNAIASPLLEVNITGARGVLFNVVGGRGLGLQEVNQAAQVIEALADPDAEIIFGAAIDPELGDEIKITVIATGFATAKANQPVMDELYDEAEDPANDDPEPEEERPLPVYSRDRSPGVRALRTEEIPAVDTEVPAFLRRSVTAR